MGPNLVALYRRAADLADKILRGRRADIPAEQATRFDLIINLKTTKALGLTVPPSKLTTSPTRPSNDLVRRGVLERWYDFSNKAEEAALREWCVANGIDPAGP